MTEYTAEQVRATILVLNDRMPSDHPAIKLLEAYAATLEARESASVPEGWVAAKAAYRRMAGHGPHDHHP